MVRIFLTCSFLMAISWAQAQSAAEYLFKGDQSFEQGDFNAALENYVHAQALDPNNPVSHYNLGKIFQDAGEFDKAEGHYHKALERPMNNILRFKSEFNLGTTLINKNIYDQAAEHLKNALKIMPNDKDAQYNLSYALQQLNQLQESKNPSSDNQSGENEEEEKKDESSEKDQQDKQNNENGTKEEENNQQSGSDELSEDEKDYMLQFLDQKEQESLNQQKNKYDGRINKSSKQW